MSSSILDQLTIKDKVIFASVTLTTGLLTAYILDKLNKLNDKPKVMDLQPKELILKTLPHLKNLNKIYAPGYERSKISKEIKNAANVLLEELKLLDSPTCQIKKVGHLAWDLQVTEFPTIISPMLGDSKYRSVFGGEGFLPDDSFIYLNSYILSNANFGPHRSISQAEKWLRAGPRKHLFFESDEVKAAIVTCGGLCPGLNVVIREIVMSLSYNYKVKEIYGIQFGYRGFYQYDWLELTPEKVKSIHHLGGTILGSSRGGFDLEKICDGLEFRHINQLYVIGGDGTHYGMQKIQAEVARRGIKMAVCGLPKTIDNDIPIIDKSFGFETSVEEAEKAIQSAYVESHASEYGVGLVRLMGRFAGFIAMEASSASRDVNICLVPEFKFDINGSKGLLEYISKRLLAKRHVVIVVAEGAGDAMRDEKLPDIGVDATGNIKPGDIGDFLRTRIVDYCKQQKIDISLKYIDPAYMIRTVPANSYDKKLCSQLAHNATHGLMAGFTGFSAGHVNNKVAFIPIGDIVSDKYKYAKRIQPNDRAWQRLIASTGQPSFLNDENGFIGGSC